MLQIFIICIFFLNLPDPDPDVGSKIYLIRHAPVLIENPGWCSAERAKNYKEQYAQNSIHKFDPNDILNEIDHPENIDTVFCSPLLRAIQTADLIFDQQVFLRISENLTELDYPVIQPSRLRLPAKVWLTTSWLLWMAGNNNSEKLSYKERKEDLENYSNELITYAERHGKTVVIAHGFVNRELIIILKKKGWKFEKRDGYKNLSVNCLVK